jgi:hypothetical protein
VGNTYAIERELGGGGMTRICGLLYFSLAVSAPDLRAVAA